MRINKKTIAWLALFLLLYLVVLSLDAQGAGGARVDAYRQWGLLAMIVLFVQLISVKSMTGTYLSPYAIFLVSFALFSFGQPIVYYFGMEEHIKTDVALLSSYGKVIKAAKLSLQCMIALHMGALVYFDKAGRKVKLQGEAIERDKERQAIYSVGHITFAVCVVPIAVYLAYTMIVASDLGYLAINDRSDSTFVSKIMSYVTLYFQCALVLCLVGSRNNKKRFDAYLWVVVVYAVLVLMMGERTEPTAQLLFAFWLRAKYFGTARKGQFLFLLLLVFVLLTVFPAIMENRYGGLITLEVLWESIKEKNFFTILAESVSSLGYSIFPLTMTMDLVPATEPYRCGLTYLAALTGIIPYLGIANKYSTLGSWLKDRLSMSYGPGYSIPAEVYINFGEFVFVPMLFTGWIMAKFLHIYEYKGKFNYISLMVSGMVLITQVTLPRREFLGAVRDIFYIMIPLYLAVNYLCKKREN